MSFPYSPARQLNRLRLRSGLSLEKLARAMGFGRASSIQRYESEDYFETEYLPLAFVRKLAEVLPGLGKPPITADDVWSLAGVKSEKDGSLRVTSATARLEESARGYGGSPAVASQDMIPCFSGLVAGENDMLHLPQEAADLRQRPVALTGVVDAYMLVMPGSIMHPKYPENVVLHVNPYLAPRPGRGVVVRLTRGRALVREYVQQKASGLLLRQYQPLRESQLAKADIVAVHTIVGTDET